jgi:uncharacterized protein (DUF305 family)
MRISLLFATALLLAACAGAQPAPGLAPATDQAAHATRMGHGADHGVADASTPYDARFIDSMIVHHQGAIDMAAQALQRAERPELKTLAENVISAQTAEIAQLREWRGSWFPELPETGGMGMAMGDMAIADDPERPFDLRFIEAMIAHHEGAIAMAQDARQHAEHQELRSLADDIIAAQEAEIAQMRAWHQAWSDT